MDFPLKSRLKAALEIESDRQRAIDLARDPSHPWWADLERRRGKTVARLLMSAGKLSRGVEASPAYPEMALGALLGTAMPSFAGEVRPPEEATAYFGGYARELLNIPGAPLRAITHPARTFRSIMESPGRAALSTGAWGLRSGLAALGLHPLAAPWHAVGPLMAEIPGVISDYIPEGEIAIRTRKPAREFEAGLPGFAKESSGRFTPSTIPTLPELSIVKRQGGKMPPGVRGTKLSAKDVLGLGGAFAIGAVAGHMDPRQVASARALGLLEGKPQAKRIRTILEAMTNEPDPIERAHLSRLMEGQMDRIVRRDPELASQIQEAFASLPAEPAARLPRKVGIVLGRKTHVRIPERPGVKPKMGARYAAVEASDLQTSHDPFSLGVNPVYPKRVQGREYGSPTRGVAERQKLAAYEKDPDLDLLLADTPSPKDGGPQIFRSGLVIGGNGRTILIRRLYAAGEPGQLYRQSLIQRAATFGLDPADLEAMKEPILVRVFDKSSKTVDDLMSLSDDLNVDPAPGLDMHSLAVVRGRKVDDETFRWIGANLEAMEEPNLRAFLETENGKVLLGRLMGDGAILWRDMPTMRHAKTGALTDHGASFIEALLVGRVIDDPALLSALPASLRQKIAAALPDILRAESAGPAWSVTEALQRAAALVTRAKADGLSVEGLAAQIGMFDQPDLPVLKFAKALETLGPLKFKRAMRLYSDRAIDAAAHGSDFFAPPSSRGSELSAILVRPEAAATEAFGGPLIEGEPPRIVTPAAVAAPAEPPIHIPEPEVVPEVITPTGKSDPLPPTPLEVLVAAKTPGAGNVPSERLIQSHRVLKAAEQHLQALRNAGNMDAFIRRRASTGKSSARFDVIEPTFAGKVFEGPDPQLSSFWNEMLRAATNPNTKSWIGLMRREDAIKIARVPSAMKALRDGEPPRRIFEIMSQRGFPLPSARPTLDLEGTTLGAVSRSHPIVASESGALRTFEERLHNRIRESKFWRGFLGESTKYQSRLWLASLSDETAAAAAKNERVVMAMRAGSEPRRLYDLMVEESIPGIRQVPQPRPLLNMGVQGGGTRVNIVPNAGPAEMRAREATRRLPVAPSEEVMTAASRSQLEEIATGRNPLDGPPPDDTPFPEVAPWEERGSRSTATPPSGPEPPPPGGPPRSAGPPPEPPRMPPSRPPASERLKSQINELFSTIELSPRLRKRFLRYHTSRLASFYGGSTKSRVDALDETEAITVLRAIQEEPNPWRWSTREFLSPKSGEYPVGPDIGEWQWRGFGDGPETYRGRMSPLTVVVSPEFFSPASRQMSNVFRNSERIKLRHYSAYLKRLQAAQARLGRRESDAIPHYLSVEKGEPVVGLKMQLTDRALAMADYHRDIHGVSPRIPMHTGSLSAPDWIKIGAFLNTRGSRQDPIKWARHFGLTGRHLYIALEHRKIYDEIIQQMRDRRLLVRSPVTGEISPIEAIEDFFHHTWVDENGIPMSRERVLEALETGRFVPPREMFFPGALTRKGAPGYTLRADHAMRAYLRGSLRRLYTEPAVKYAGGLMNRIESLGYQGSSWVTERGYLESYMKHVMLGQPSAIEKGTDLLLQRMSKPILAMSKRASATLDRMPAADRTLGPLFRGIERSLTAGRPSKRASAAMMRWWYRLLLGAAIDSAFINSTQAFNSIIRLGLTYRPDQLVKGYSEAIGAAAARLPGFRRSKALKKLRDLRGEFYDETEITTADVFNLEQSSAFWKKHDDIILAPFQYVEAVNRGATGFWAYRQATQRGLTHEQAIRYAQQIIRETQFEYGRVGMSPYLQEPLLRPFAQFTSFWAKQAEMWAYWAANGEMEIAKSLLSGRKFSRAELGVGKIEVPNVAERTRLLQFFGTLGLIQMGLDRVGVDITQDIGVGIFPRATAITQGRLTPTMRLVTESMGAGLSEMQKTFTVPSLTIPRWKARLSRVDSPWAAVGETWRLVADGRLDLAMNRLPYFFRPRYPAKVATLLRAWNTGKIERERWVSSEIGVKRVPRTARTISRPGVISEALGVDTKKAVRERKMWDVLEQLKEIVALESPPRDDPRMRAMTDLMTKYKWSETEVRQRAKEWFPEYFSGFSPPSFASPKVSSGRSRSRRRH
jgi:hypothetical protein